MDIPASTPFTLTAAFIGIADKEGKADAHTPITVKVYDDERGMQHYALTSASYDAERGEFVLVIDQSAPTPGRER